MNDLPFTLPRYLRRVGEHSGILVENAEVAADGKLYLFGPGVWLAWSDIFEHEPRRWEHSDHPSRSWWKIVPIATFED